MVGRGRFLLLLRGAHAGGPEAPTRLSPVSGSLLQSRQTRTRAAAQLEARQQPPSANGPLGAPPAPAAALTTPVPRVPVGPLHPTVSCSAFAGVPRLLPGGSGTYSLTRPLPAGALHLRQRLRASAGQGRPPLCCDVSDHSPTCFLPSHSVAAASPGLHPRDICCSYFHTSRFQEG